MNSLWIEVEYVKALDKTILSQSFVTTKTHFGGALTQHTDEQAGAAVGGFMLGLASATLIFGGALATVPAVFFHASHETAWGMVWTSLLAAAGAIAMGYGIYMAWTWARALLAVIEEEKGK